ncbi:hypothetical protein H2248_012016 [Termitomyces sp. 'cryptogamus']|nr:hypothetical protein H2248_012016 [Termitomyces sp. 'cryptogamus']
MSSDCIFIDRRRRHASFSERLDEYIVAIDEEFHLPIGRITNGLRRLSFASIKSSSSSTTTTATTSSPASAADIAPVTAADKYKERIESPSLGSGSEYPFPVVRKSETTIKPAWTSLTSGGGITSDNHIHDVETEEKGDEEELYWGPSVRSRSNHRRHAHVNDHSRSDERTTSSTRKRGSGFGRRMSELIRVCHHRNGPL